MVSKHTEQRRRHGREFLPRLSRAHMHVISVNGILQTLSIARRVPISASQPTFGSGDMNDTEQKLKFITLRAQGKALTTIAPLLGVSRQTLANWEEDLGEEIRNLKAIELDALRETYFVTKQAKIEEIAALRRKIREELDKRDFSDVSTAKLLQLDLEYQAKLETEFANVRPKSERELIKQKEKKELYCPPVSKPSSSSKAPALLLDSKEPGNGKRRRGQMKAN